MFVDGEIPSIPIEPIYITFETKGKSYNCFIDPIHIPYHSIHIPVIFL